MRVKSLTIVPYDVSLNKPFTYSTQSLLHLPYALVKVEADNSMTGSDRSGAYDVRCETQDLITGLGECAVAYDVTGETQESACSLESLLSSLVVGKDINSIHDVRTINQDIARYIYNNSAVKAGVEAALCDALSYGLQVPLWQLFDESHQYNLSVPVTIPILSSDQDLCTYLRELEQESPAYVKVKIGSDLSFPKMVLRAIRDVLPKSSISVDANQAWDNWQEAMAAIVELDEFDLSWVEQPLRAHDFQGLASLCQESPTGIMVDESVHTLQDCITLHSMGALECVNIKLAKSGGMINALKIVNYCDSQEIPYIIGSMLESPIGTAVNVHFASITKCDAVNVGGNCFVENQNHRTIKFDGHIVNALDLHEYVDESD